MQQSKQHNIFFWKSLFWSFQDGFQFLCIVSKVTAQTLFIYFYYYFHLHSYFPLKERDYKTPVNNIIIATITGRHSFKSFFVPLLQQCFQRASPQLPRSITHTNFSDPWVFLWCKQMVDIYYTQWISLKNTQLLRFWSYPCSWTFNRAPASWKPETFTWDT